MTWTVRRGNQDVQLQVGAPLYTSDFLRTGQGWVPASEYPHAVWALLRAGQGIWFRAGDAFYASDLVSTGWGWIPLPQHPTFARFFQQPRAVAPPTMQSPGSSLLGALAAGGLVALGGCALWKVFSDPEPRRIRQIARQLEEGDALVFADVKGWPRPPIRNGRIADVHAIYPNGEELLVEVENERSLGRSHARAQVRDLMQWASEAPGRHFSLEVVAGGRGGRS